MRSLTVVCALFAACGNPFEGTFETQVQGQSATLSLEVDGDRLTGKARYMGYESTVDGTIDGESASGTVDLMGRTVRFEAKLTDDDTLEWRYPQMQLAFTFRRGDDDDSGSSDGGGGSRDGRLVGAWRRTVSGNTGVGANRIIMSNDIYCTFRGDGTFEYGGARGGVVGPGSWPGVETGPAAVTRGDWKTEGNVLYSRVSGGSWTPVGRYSISGSGLVVYAGGQPQYWERQ